MPDAPTHIVLLNTKAGSTSVNLQASIRARFRAHGITADVRPLAAGEDVTAAAKRALSAGPRVIVGAGGDGTLNAIARALVGGTVTFGVLPLGTLNHFAKDLSIPQDLDAAIDTICTGRLIRVDVGRINDH